MSVIPDAVMLLYATVLCLMERTPRNPNFTLHQVALFANPGAASKESARPLPASCEDMMCYNLQMELCRTFSPATASRKVVPVIKEPNPSDHVRQDQRRCPGAPLPSFHLHGVVIGLAATLLLKKKG